MTIIPIGHWSSGRMSIALVLDEMVGQTDRRSNPDFATSFVSHM
jgi:hypothetical protein